jgi:hypothetical protein
VRAEQAKVCACGEHKGRLVRQLDVGNVTVRKHDLVSLVCVDEARQFTLRLHGNAAGYSAPAKTNG